MKFYTKVQLVSAKIDSKLAAALHDGTYIAEDGWTVVSVQFMPYTYIITLQKPVDTDEVLRAREPMEFSKSDSIRVDARRRS